MRTPLLALTAFALAACGLTDNSEPNPIEQVAGTYTLVSLHGDVLPVPLNDPEADELTVYLVDGSLALAVDSSFAMRFFGEYETGRDTTLKPVLGTYTATPSDTGHALSLSSTNGFGTYEAEVIADTVIILLSAEGLRFVR